MPEWMRRARCRGADNPELFFPEKGDNTLRALNICASCPVTIECADFGTKIGAKFGIWGGVVRGKPGPSSREERLSEHRLARLQLEREKARARYELKYAKSFAIIEARKQRQANR